jgi:DNA-binding beta-propeller fold protein YncE
VTALLAILALAAPPVHATISAPPKPLLVGKTWNATLVVKPGPTRRPVVVARPVSGRAVVFGARKVRPGRYRVAIKLKAVGSWRLSVRIGRRTKALRTVKVVPLPPPVSPLPGGTAYRVCGGLREPYRQYGLAVGFGSAWLACGANGVQRVDTTTGAVTARIRVPGAALWSIAAGEGSVWAVELQGSTLYRISPGSNVVLAAIQLGARVPYIWAGGGAAWAANDGGQSLLRVDPLTNQLAANVGVGDGPAGFAFDGSYVWVLNHRENTLDRIDPATNGVTRMAVGLGGTDAAAERIAVFEGDLWITGRGLDLLRVSRSTGAILGTTEIGAGGIDVRAAGSKLWVASYEAEGDRLGQPIVSELLRIDASGAISQRIAPTRRLFANGLAVDEGSVFVFDSVAGLFVRLPS